MPLYEYECDKCGTTFERRQGFNDAPLQQCPQGHTEVRRVYAPVGIVFKGSGFYMTDYNRTSSNTGEGK